MISKRLKDIKIGEILAKDVYRSRNAETASKEIPVITRGTPLTQPLVLRLIKLFGEDFEIIVFTEEMNNKNVLENASFQEQIKNITEDIESHSNHPAVVHQITREEAIELYKRSIYTKEVYKRTKERLINAYKEINSLMEDFKTTKKLNDKKLEEVGEKLVECLQKEPENFSPVFVYLIELEIWDELTFNHSFDVAVIMLAFASSVSNNTEELTSMFIAGLIHDIGKFLYSKYNLNEMDYIIKKEGRLTDEEFNQIKKHVDVEDFLSSFFHEFNSRARDNIIYGAIEHHEKFNGHGYIHNKQGMEISFAARMIAICDVYDAIIRERRYKNAVKPNIAIEMLKQFTAQGHFDPVLFNRFYKTFGKYPVGSVIKTNQGIGVVVEQSSNHERPIIFFPDRGEVNTSKIKSIEILEDEAI